MKLSGVEDSMTLPRQPAVQGWGMDTKKLNCTKFGNIDAPYTGVSTAPVAKLQVPSEVASLLGQVSSEYKQVAIVPQ